jgi:NADP-dependent 3-hydroxy acid dehydrogenase YdfG
VADSDVRVIVISPGAVETELLGHTTDEEAKQEQEEFREVRNIHHSPVCSASFSSFLCLCYVIRTQKMGRGLDSDAVAEAIRFAYEQVRAVVPIFFFFFAAASSQLFFS